MTCRLPTVPALFAALALLPPRAAGQVTDIQYDLRYDQELARQRLVGVGMSFRAPGSEPVLLSLPAWTPGAYEISNFAQDVRDFRAVQGDDSLRWDKQDHDTWRVWPGRAGELRIDFRFLADSLDNAMAWSQPDFLLVNGTNVFLYPEGQGFDFPATVTIHTEPGWRVATGMRSAGQANLYRESNYHDLVDMPFFIGKLDIDTVTVEGQPYPVASWPSGALQGPARQLLHRHIREMMPPMIRVFGETPWESYTTLLIFHDSYAGGSALEHQNSHVGVYNPGFIGTPLLASITAHEVFHGWNVKRLRPSDLFPYDYDEPQPTPWLWVSEGITDYYADLALVRGGIVDSTVFLALLTEKLFETDNVPPIALEDASLSTWVHPTDGTAYVYYPKGALAGFLLDIMIRDASDNRSSLDDLLRILYQRTWKAGRGFTTADWQAALREVSGGSDFADFHRRHVDGREPFPWERVLPRAGLRLSTDSLREPRIGVLTQQDSAGTLVTEVTPGSAAAEAGIEAGDYLVRVGDVPVEDETFGPRFRARYTREQPGIPLVFVVRRNGAETTLQGRLRFESQIIRRIEPDPRAGLKAVRIRGSIWSGR